MRKDIGTAAPEPIAGGGPRLVKLGDRQARLHLGPGGTVTLTPADLAQQPLREIKDRIDARP